MRRARESAATARSLRRRRFALKGVHSLLYRWQTLGSRLFCFFELKKKKKNLQKCPANSELHPNHKNPREHSFGISALHGQRHGAISGRERKEYDDAMS